MPATGFSILLLPIFKTVMLALLMGVTVEMLLPRTGLLVASHGGRTRSTREDELRPSDEGADQERSKVYESTAASVDS